jgi:hypothetical protein
MQTTIGQFFPVFLGSIDMQTTIGRFFHVFFVGELICKDVFYRVN